MIFEASEFTFHPPPQVARARRVLIKPLAYYPKPHPWTTSRQTLERVIEGIRRVSDTDIILMEGNPEGKAMRPIYQALGYHFPRVLTLDVKDSLWVEIENPLSKALALSAVWVPNVLLSCDYWISIAPFREGGLTIPNLLSLLPTAKYRQEELHGLGIDRVVADLYFTLPFDLGVVDGRKKLVGDSAVEEWGKVLVGEPFAVDEEASRLAGSEPTYLELIRQAKAELES